MDGDEALIEEKHEMVDVVLGQEEIVQALEEKPLKRPPKVELKYLPSTLRYAFLGSKDTFPVIISSYLDTKQVHKLLEVLRAHQSAIGYSIDDLKGISPTLFMHHIELKELAKPSIERQRKLNPSMGEVVKKEILKLLDAGVIYPIVNSRWVAPVHVVPKKGGMTVVRNERGELISTSTTCNTPSFYY